MTLDILEPFDARIPKWDLSNLSVRTCPFCKKNNLPFFKRPDQLSVAFCKSCGCWYVCNLPPVQSIEGFYDNYYYNHYVVTDFSNESVSQIIENARKTIKTNRQLHLLSKMLGGLHGKRIMDVGCGIGNFLLSARCLGADVVGCDLSSEACAFAQNILNISVHQSDLDSCSSSIGNVDAVLMRDFIEHPVEPLIDIEAAIRILNPGGIILLLTPNGGEAGVDIKTAKGWIGFRVDLEHLQYLSSQTINWLSDEYNFNIEYLAAYGFPHLGGFPHVIGGQDLHTNANSRSRVLQQIKNLLRKIPGARKTLRIFQAIGSEITGNDPVAANPGYYHLLAVFRKMQD